MEQGSPASPLTVSEGKHQCDVSSHLLLARGSFYHEKFTSPWRLSQADGSMSPSAPLKALSPTSNYKVNDLLNREPSQYIPRHAVHIPWAVYGAFE